MAKNLSLQRRPLPDLDPKEEELFRKYCLELVDEDKVSEAILKMLGHSRPFLSLLEYIDNHSNQQAVARIVQVDKEFQNFFTRKQKEYSFERLNWFVELSGQRPNIMTNALGRPVEMCEVSHGWHALLSPSQSQDDHFMVGAKVERFKALQGPQISKLISSLFPNKLSQHQNIRMESNRLEDITGLRKGRIHFFLADDAMKNLYGLALHSSHVSDDVNDYDLVVFTMHARFFFVCAAVDLKNWLKTNEARFAFDDKVRVQGYDYSAVLRDFEGLGDDQIQKILEQMRIRADRIAGGKIRISDKNPKEKVLLGAVNQALNGTTRLNWTGEEIMELVRSNAVFAGFFE